MSYIPIFGPFVEENSRLKHLLHDRVKTSFSSGGEIRVNCYLRTNAIRQPYERVSHNSPIKNGAQCFFRFKLFINLRRPVQQEPLLRDSLLFLGEPVACQRVLGQVPQRKRGQDDAEPLLDDEEIFPPWDCGVVDLEYTEREQTGECTGDFGGAVEDGEAEGKFVASVEQGEIKDYAS